MRSFIVNIFTMKKRPKCLLSAIAILCDCWSIFNPSGFAVAIFRSVTKPKTLFAYCDGSANEDKKKYNVGILAGNVRMGKVTRHEIVSTQAPSAK